MSADQRITVVVAQATKSIRDWNYSRSAALQLAFLDSLDSLKFTLNLASRESSLDLGRIIVDRAASADDVLDFLTAVPSEFGGDIVFIREDGSGFLSATGRGGDRVMYRLFQNDVRFYLETHDLVTDRIAEPAVLQATA